MKKISIIASTIGLLLVASPAFAVTASTTQARLETRIQVGKDRATQEIDRRIGALNVLITRLNAMTRRLTADEKTSLSASLQSQITALNTLKAKIAADTDLATLKTDIKSITGSYRIFVLVIPQAHIAATSDSILAAVGTMNSLITKLQARITTEQGGGTDVTAMNSLISDAQAKLADATTQANAAVGYTLNLKPDNGDQTILKANQAAFTKAKADIKVGRSDLEAARKDLRKVFDQLKANLNQLNPNASTTHS